MLSSYDAEGVNLSLKFSLNSRQRRLFATSDQPNEKNSQTSSSKRSIKDASSNGDSHRQIMNEKYHRNCSRDKKRAKRKAESLTLVIKRTRLNSEEEHPTNFVEELDFHDEDDAEIGEQQHQQPQLKLSFPGFRRNSSGIIEFVRDGNIMNLSSDSPSDEDDSQEDYYHNSWAEKEGCGSSDDDDAAQNNSNNRRVMQAEFNSFDSVDEGREAPDHRLTKYALKKRRQERLHCNKARSKIEHFREEVVDMFDMGLMDNECPHCGAKYFKLEATTKKVFTKCCSEGAVKISEIKPPTEYVLKLLTGEASDSHVFQTYSRTFNNLLSMASVSLNTFKFKTNSLPAIRISGSVYHTIGPVLPADECPASFLQVFFHENQSNNTINTENMSKPAVEMMNRLRQEIAQHNKFIEIIKPLATAYGNLPDYYIKMSDVKPTEEVQNRVYNLPSCNEVGVILCGDTTDPYNCASKRSVVIKLKSDQASISKTNSRQQSELQRIDSTSKFYDPLGYSITHMHGSFGFQFGMKRRDTKSRNNQLSDKKLTCLDYYSYCAHIRSRERDTLLYGSLMSQQYWVDMYVKIETERLLWIRNHQDKIKAEIYQGLKDAVDREDANVNDMGRTIILPSSVSGCPRQMIQNFQDAMAVVAKYGKPSYFITFTCNPDWPEIKEIMSTVANDNTRSRADVNDRVFKLKLNELLKDLVERGVLGQHVAHCYTIEFQKRGLPHAHILLIVKELDKPKTADDYDAVVCAEIPDPVTQPELYKLVTQHMMHGPCGALAPNPRNCPCTNDAGDCSKRYPKEFIDITEDSEDCYPVYRRRSVADGGRVYEKRINGNYTVEMSNQWVVPYNPYLLMKYKAHLNVEICCTVRSVKYLYKYIHKGPDMASFNLQEQRRAPKVGIYVNPQNDFHNGSSSNVAVNGNNVNNNSITPAAVNNSSNANSRPIKRDEITEFVQGRYISPPEAFWRIYSFEMGAIYPSVQRLQVHLKGQNTVTFQQGNAEQAVTEVKDTTLMAFFKKVKEERDSIPPKPDSYYGINPRTGKLNKKGCELTYPEFPQHYTFNKTTHEWTRRKTSCRDTIGRMYNVHELSGNGERYFLRLLLSTVVNKASFEELLIVERPLNSHSSHLPLPSLPLPLNTSNSNYITTSNSSSICLSTNNDLNLTSVNSNFTASLNLNANSTNNNNNNIKVCSSYKEVCNELGLIGDDNEWVRCLDEQCIYQCADELRYLFAMLLVYNNVQDPNKLYLQFRDELSFDCKRERVRRLSSVDYTVENRKYLKEDYNEALFLLNNHIMSMTHSEKNTDTFGLPEIDITLLYNAPSIISTTLLEDALNYEVDVQSDLLNAKLSIMNTDQLHIYNIAKIAINSYVEMIKNRSVVSRNRFIYFVDAFGGAGKTFVMNAILNYVRSLQKVAIAVSSSAISAILLTDGTTAHSRFKIPIPICRESFMNFSKSSQTAELLRQCTVIIWDEATMTQKKVFEAFDRTMKDLMGNDLTFGGKVVIMGGDFRQTLPVIKRAGRGGIVHEIIKQSWIWKEVQTMSLTINERVNQAQSNMIEHHEMKEFSDFLLAIGNDEIEIETQLGDNVIRIPDKYVFDSSQGIGDLLNWMYSNEDEDDEEVIEFCDKAILTPVNTDVDMINNIGISKMVGTMYELDSCNIAKYDDPNARHVYPQEFLKQIGGSGFPPDKLKLKVGAPVMLLRNLDQKKGLCNGTRLKITQIGRFRLQARIMSGNNVGALVVIPRIELTPNDQEFPFILTRRQFPIQLAFAMTINKSQGQSFKKVGVYLGKPVFTHGQLYVACSRCGNPRRTKLLIKQVNGIQGRFDGVDGIYTRNVVYREVLST